MRRKVPCAPIEYSPTNSIKRGWNYGGEPDIKEVREETRSFIQGARGCCSNSSLLTSRKSNRVLDQECHHRCGPSTCRRIRKHRSEDRHRWDGNFEIFSVSVLWIDTAKLEDVSSWDDSVNSQRLSRYHLTTSWALQRLLICSKYSKRTNRKNLNQQSVILPTPRLHYYRPQATYTQV